MNEIISSWNEYIRKYPEYRVGQALFNRLRDGSPKIAEAIRGVPHLDPYYRDENIGDCLGFIATHLQSSVSEHA